MNNELTNDQLITLLQGHGTILGDRAQEVLIERMNGASDAKYVKVSVDNLRPLLKDRERLDKLQSLVNYEDRVIFMKGQDVRAGMDKESHPVCAGDPVPGVNAVAAPDVPFFTNLPDPYRAQHLAIMNAVPLQVCTVEMALEWVVQHLPTLLHEQKGRQEENLKWRRMVDAERQNVCDLENDLQIQKSLSSHVPIKTAADYVASEISIVDYWKMKADNARMDYLEQDAEGRHTDGLTLRQRVDKRMQEAGNG